MRRVVLGVLVLAVFLPATVLARAQFLCNVDRVVREHCCCPPKKPQPPAHEPRMQPECCKIVQHSPATMPVASAQTHEPAVVAALAIVVMSPVVIAPVRDERLSIAPRAQAPPVERSLFSQRCALLV